MSYLCALRVVRLVGLLVARKCYVASDVGLRKPIPCPTNIHNISLDLRVVTCDETSNHFNVGYEDTSNTIDPELTLVYDRWHTRDILATKKVRDMQIPRYMLILACSWFALSYYYPSTKRSCGCWI